MNAYRTYQNLPSLQPVLQQNWCVGEVNALALQLPPIPASVGFASPRLSGCCAPTQVHRESTGVLTLSGNGLALPTVLPALDFQLIFT